MPTVVAQPQPAAPVTPPPVVSPRPVAAAPARKGSALLFAGVGLVVLLLIAGVGGYVVMHTMMNKPADKLAGTANTDSSSGGSAEVASGHEVGRYWVQVNTADKSANIRADRVVQMKSGQQFKFHFSPSENGYLYLIGPGNNNAPTTFLTSKPAAQFGVKTNQIHSGQERE